MCSYEKNYEELEKRNTLPFKYEPIVEQNSHLQFAMEMAHVEYNQAGVSVSDMLKKVESLATKGTQKGRNGT